LMLPAQPVDSVGYCEHAQPIGIVARQRKAQDGEVPCAQQSGIPFDCSTSDSFATPSLAAESNPHQTRSSIPCESSMIPSG
jgi:hypothetical protein